MRFHASRGSMDLSQKDGGLPPDSVVQTIDEIMEGLPSGWSGYGTTPPASPCVRWPWPLLPFSVSGTCSGKRQPGRDPGRAAAHPCSRDQGRGAVHPGEIRPAARGLYAEPGLDGPDVWYAHGIHFNDDELRILAETGTGVAHCPVSNMKLSSGVCRVPEHAAAGDARGAGGGWLGLQRRLQPAGGRCGWPICSSASPHASAAPTGYAF